jgi:protein-tyrosine phosphatase
MPYSRYDRRGRVLTALRERGVSLVVLLAETDECRARSGRDLPALYAERGIAVVHVPAPDFGAPSQAALGHGVARTLEALRAGTAVAAHCHAGEGRTGILAACVAGEALGLGAEEAIAWVRRFVPRAMGAPGQEAAVHDYRAARPS